MTASATAVTASSCPMTRLCSSSSRLNSFRISPSSNFDTGMPVQRLTTSAMSSSSTSSLSKRSPSPRLRARPLRACSSRSSSSRACRTGVRRLVESYWRSACSISTLVRSICSRTERSALNRVLFELPARLEPVGLLTQFGEFLLDASRAAAWRRRRSPCAAPRARSRAA